MALLSLKTLSFHKVDSMKQKLYYTLYVLLVLAIFAIMFILNMKTPMIGDDYVYSFIFTTPDKIVNIADIFVSQSIHYNVWGGRIIVHTILQYILLLKNPVLTSAINSAIFVLFIILIQWHAIGKLKLNFTLTLIIFSLLVLLQPAFGETCLWLTGSLNYLWGTTIILLFLLPYRLNKNKKKSKIQILLSSSGMFVFGIIAGWVSENLSLAMIFSSLFFIIYYKKNKVTISAWMVTGIIGALIGYTMMILAPGNYARAAEAGPTTLFLIIYRFFNYTESFVYYLGLINLLIVIALILYKRQIPAIFLRIRPFLIIYAIGIIISIYAMVASPSFPPRAWFGVITLNIIILIATFYNIDKDLFTNFLRIKICIIVFCLTSLAFNIYDAYNDINRINIIWNNRMAKINNAKYSNNKQIEFERYYSKTKFGMSDAPYANEYISKYYNIDFKLK